MGILEIGQITAIFITHQNILDLNLIIEEQREHIQNILDRR